MYMYVAISYHMVPSKLSILAAIINSSNLYSIIKLYRLRAFLLLSLLDLNPPFHWTAIPLRFEILIKMTRIVAETARVQ